MTAVTAESAPAARGAAGPERLPESVDGVVASKSATDSRLYGFAETLGYLGLLNLLMIAGVLAGAVVLGIAPTLSAAVVCSRARLNHDEKGTIRRFWGAWASGFGRAHLLQLPGAVVGLLLALNLTLSWGSDAVWLPTGLLVGLGAVAAYQIIVVTMDANYTLRIRDCWHLASRFMVHAPGAPLLLLSSVAIIGALCLLLPGLIPVFALGTTVHICTALCLSFYAANDRKITA